VFRAHVRDIEYRQGETITNGALIDRQSLNYRFQAGKNAQAARATRGFFSIKRYLAASSRWNYSETNHEKAR
jgi:hypothetical protein